MEKYHLANLPTPLEKLQRLSDYYGLEIYLKRDDYTGIELSGNKARKLEYLMADAISQGYDTVLTCGGTQSNHARATAVAAKKLGLDCALILENTYENLNEGNLFLNRMLGADIYFAEPGYYGSGTPLEKQIIEQYATQGKKVYPIPLGGSNALGSLGYVDAASEILAQLSEINVEADMVVSTVGSGGTYSGLLYGLKENQFNGRVLGVNISRNAASYEVIVKQLLKDIAYLKGTNVNFETDIEILDGYVGEGYAKTSSEVMRFMQQFAQHTGVFLDPVYTGKAFFGFFDAYQKGLLGEVKRVVLLHSGGIFGYRPDQRELILKNQ